jgi:hypothetical protein
MDICARRGIIQESFSMKSIVLVGSICAFACVAAAQQETPRQDFSLQYNFIRSSSNNGPALHIVNDQPVLFQAGGGNNTLNGAGGQYGYNFNHWLSGIADLYAVHMQPRFGPWTDPVTGLAYNGGRQDTTIFHYQFGPRVYIRKWQHFTPFAEFFLGGANGKGSISIDLNAISLPVSQTQTVTTPDGREVTTGVLANGKEVTISNVTGPNGQTITLAALPNGQTIAVTNVNGQFFENASINVQNPLRTTNVACNRVLSNGTCNYITRNSVRARTSQNVFAYNVGGGVDIPINHYVTFRPVEVDMQYSQFSVLRGFGNQNQYNFRYSAGMVFTFGKID